MIRRADIKDIDAIYNVEQSCFTSPWSRDMLLQSLQSGCVMLVCEEAGVVMGYAGIYPGGDITNIAVLPDFRRKGYGKMLVTALIDNAKHMCADGIFLEVRVSNKAAISLYEKCGFKQIAVRRKYYSDGEDALIYAFGGV